MPRSPSTCTTCLIWSVPSEWPANRCSALPEAWEKAEDHYCDGIKCTGKLKHSTTTQRPFPEALNCAARTRLIFLAMRCKAPTCCQSLLTEIKENISEQTMQHCGGCDCLHGLVDFFWLTLSTDEKRALKCRRLRVTSHSDTCGAFRRKGFHLIDRNCVLPGLRESHHQVTVSLPTVSNRVHRPRETSGKLLIIAIK